MSGDKPRTPRTTYVPDDFRGVGWAWPVRVDEPSGEPPEGQRPVSISAYEQSIRESILLILGTAKGERVMRPTFGCGVYDYVFSPLTTATAALMSRDVRNALLEWEPRIEVVEVRFDAEPDAPEGAKVVARIGYLVRATNTVFNLVYPFYLPQTGARA